jgi:hypothetical protein
VQPGEDAGERVDRTLVQPCVTLAQFRHPGGVQPELEHEVRPFRLGAPHRQGQLWDRLGEVLAVEPGREPLVLLEKPASSAIASNEALT